jgi:acyl transferase domain-containing protein/NADPH:quinone reductase-like Zn-dependent oxidoreductase
MPSILSYYEFLLIHSTAGITLQEISGSNTSVFVGSFTNDYHTMLTKDLEQYPKYMVTGTGNAILSNRISYFYNLHGSSVTVDTACSSSLVCFDLGNKSLQSGESEISIIAGSALHFDPSNYITMTDLGMLSADGRCHTFDSMASGYVRGEGVAAVVLKRKSSALRSGEYIRAIVRATRTNHDGTKGGITLPSSTAQESLIRETYRLNGLDPADTSYFEAHGTGTKAGDPREASAIGAVFATKRENPLYVGSVKTNIGHLEGASGLAGIIKVVLALEHRTIPPNMHFSNPNPEIKFEEWNITVPTQAIPWDLSSGVRRASVNSFGYGGTNGHVVLEGYYPDESPPITRPSHPGHIAPIIRHRPYLLCLSSHSPDAGNLAKKALVNYLDQSPDTRVLDVIYSHNFKHTVHQHRSFAIGTDTPTLSEHIMSRQPITNWTTAQGVAPRLGFVFTGQGAQWWAMGRQLLDMSPLFRQSLERCDSILASLPDAPTWSIIQELSLEKETTHLAETKFSQPICTALQLAILALLDAWGIKPIAVVGHSSGEMAAAYAAGILSFRNTMIAAYYRGLDMSHSDADTVVPGGMMAIGLSELAARQELKAYAGRIAIAAINSPSNVTVSGDLDAIMEFREILTERKVFAKQLQVAQAFHSHHMLPWAPAYKQALDSCPGFETLQPKVRMFSSVTARLAEYENMESAYWCNNMTGTVRFRDALTGIVLDDMDNKNVDILVEIGPHPALKTPSQQTTQGLKLDIPYLASLTRGTPDFEGLLALAGQLFARGYEFDLSAPNADYYYSEDGEVHRVFDARRLTDLPSYSWNHAKYWAETRVVRDYRLRKHRQIILGAPIPGHIPNKPRWRNYLRQSELPWLVDHRIEGKVIFPASGYISMAIEAIIRLSDKPIDIATIALREVVIKSALIIPDTDAGTEVVLEMSPTMTSAKSSSNLWYDFFIYSFDDDGNCSENCRGLIANEAGVAVTINGIEPSLKFSELVLQTNRQMAAQRYYTHLDSLGLNYGTTFQLLHSSINSGAGFAVSSLAWRPEVYNIPPGQDSVLHPALLDASFHPVFAAIESILCRPLYEPYVPTFIRTMRLSGPFRTKSSKDIDFSIAAKTHILSPRVAVADLSINSVDETGLSINIHGLEVTSLGKELGYDSGRTLFFRTRWHPMFDRLEAPPGGGIAQLMDTFAHQYPNAKILHLTENAQCTIGLLELLSTEGRVRRRFKSITPWSPQHAKIVESPALASRWGPLLGTEDPKEADFDVVVTSNCRNVDVSRFAKDGGFIISDRAEIDFPGIVQLFRTPELSLWCKRQVDNQATPIQLGIVLSDCPSQRTLGIVSEIKSKHNGAVACQRMAEGAKVDLKSDAIIVLSSLDEDLLFENDFADSSDFDTIRGMLINLKCPIYWVTEGATIDGSRPEQNIIHGLASTVRTEMDDRRLVVLDVEHSSSSEVISQNILEVLIRSDKEDELSVRNGTVLIPRILADDSLNSKLFNGASRKPTLQKLNQPNRPLSLKIGRVGLLDTLAFGDNEDMTDNALGSDELEIEVRASAVSNRDVETSMGSVDNLHLGDECSGIVLRIGKDVDPEQFKPGDRVMALRPGQGAHQSMVRNIASWCCKLHGDISFSTAAAVPVALMTAYFSLVYSARLSRGETVLIHAADGGVGQMSIQLAQFLGADIIATVGSQHSRDLLKRKFGLRDECIFNSRDASFVPSVMAATNDRGVDVALNSLPGDLLQATWKCMAPFGRFIEIGHRDMRENSKISMGQFKKNISFGAVDLVTLFEQNKPLGAVVFKQCCDLLYTGCILPPDTVIEVPYAQVQRGFRYVEEGGHTGQVVLVRGKDDIVPVLPQTYRNTRLFRADRTYLIVGGLGGLGRALAQFLVRRGARSLAMYSRSGAALAEAQETVRWLRSRNIDVRIFKGDVTVYEGVLNCIRELGSALGGIFQAAMVLQDAPFKEMTSKQWQSCMAPKVQGTYNLHKASLEVTSALEFFVCFSSLSGVVGSAAQANYSAANSYMDALVAYRRSLGLPASTMNSGMIVGIGVVSQNASLQALMERTGYDPIAEEELLCQIEEAILESQGPLLSDEGIIMPQTITGINLDRQDLPWVKRPLFANIYQNHDSKSGAVSQKGAEKALSDILRATNTLEARIAKLTEAFCEKIVVVLGVPSTAILLTNKLSAYGLDSIVAMEFRKWFANSVGVELTMFDILGATSIQALATKAANAIIQTSAIPKDDRNPALTTVEARSHKPIASLKRIGPSTVIANFERPSELPMSRFQRRLWFVHNLVEDKSFMNVLITTSILGKPDLSALQLTINEVTRRNDILRTSFFEGQNISEQKVLSASVVRPLLNAKDFSKDIEPQSSLDSFIHELRKKELEIEDGQVIRFGLAKLDNQRFTFLVVYHHIAFDRGSANFLFEQLISIYDAIRSSTDLSAIPSPQISYADFTLWHNELLQSPSLRNSIEYWKQNLAGCNGVSTLLPFAKCKRSEKMDYRRARIPMIFSLKELNRLKRHCAESGVTPFHFLLAAFRSFLYRYTEEEDVVIHMIDGNRPHFELRDTVGLFVNMLPIRSMTSPEVSFDQLLQNIKIQTLDALEHGKVPFDVIVDSVDVPKDPRVFALGQIAVNYQMHGSLKAYDTADFKMLSPESQDIPSLCEIALEALEVPTKGLKLTLEYSTALYAAEDASRFMDNFLIFMRNVVKDHRQPILEIEMCGELEVKHQSSRFWGMETMSDCWSGQTVLERIYNNACTKPSAVAIITSDGASITYTELVTRAHNLGQEIGRKCVSPCSTVGVLCRPGIECVVGILSALFNGSGYLPMDPECAVERLAFMASDSSVGVILVGEDMLEDAMKIASQIAGNPELVLISATENCLVDSLMTPPKVDPTDPFYTIYTSVSRWPSNNHSGLISRREAQESPKVLSYRSPVLS